MKISGEKNVPGVFSRLAVEEKLSRLSCLTPQISIIAGPKRAETGVGIEPTRRPCTVSPTGLKPAASTS